MISKIFSRRRLCFHGHFSRFFHGDLSTFTDRNLKTLTHKNIFSTGNKKTDPNGLIVPSNHWYPVDERRGIFRTSLVFYRNESRGILGTSLVSYMIPQKLIVAKWLRAIQELREMYVFHKNETKQTSKSRARTNENVNITKIEIQLT